MIVKLTLSSELTFQYQCTYLYIDDFAIEKYSVQMVLYVAKVVHMFAICSNRSYDFF